MLMIKNLVNKTEKIINSMIINDTIIIYTLEIENERND